MGSIIKHTTKDGKSIQTKRYNQDVLQTLAIRYGVTKTFIRQSISGERVSATSDTIKKDYETTLQKLQDALK